MCVGVLCDVGETLLERPEQRQFRVLGKVRHGIRHFEASNDATSSGEVVQQRTQRRDETQVVEQRRTQRVGHVANAADAGVHQVYRTIEAMRQIGSSDSRNTPSCSLTAEKT